MLCVKTLDASEWPLEGQVIFFMQLSGPHPQSSHLESPQVEPGICNFLNLCRWFWHRARIGEENKSARNEASVLMSVLQFKLRIHLIGGFSWYLSPVSWLHGVGVPPPSLSPPPTDPLPTLRTSLLPILLPTGGCGSLGCQCLHLGTSAQSPTKGPVGALR